MNIKLFEVGGAVRDRIMGIAPKDIDYAVEAPSWEAMREYIIGKGGTIFLESPKYFTMRAKLPNIGGADFVLCRKDGIYKDGRHPESVEVGTIYDDLARRDFTMNAIARDVETGGNLDPYGGIKDIEDREIRFVGSPEARLAEDKLRAFRAIRFAVTKSFEIDQQTFEAILRISPHTFGGVSTERIREELLKMFKFDSFHSFNLLFNRFLNLGEVVRQRDIWFEPTTKSAK